MKCIMKSVNGSPRTLKNYGLTSICGWKESNYDDTLQYLNNCFSETVVREVLQVVIKIPSVEVNGRGIVRSCILFMN